MLSPVGSTSAITPDVTVYQRKAVPQVSTKVDPGTLSKPRLGGLAPPEMLAHIKQMSEAAKGAQAQANAMAKQYAALSRQFSSEGLASRLDAGSTQFSSFTANGATDPLSALFVDTKV